MSSPGGACAEVFPAPEQQHPISSRVATGMTLFRLGYGVYQTASLLMTPPEQRTWEDAGQTAGAASTDKADGVWSRRFGSTKLGPLLDRAADVTFSVGGEVALAINGEISPIHPILSIGREALVHTWRQSAIADGRPDIPVGNRGRQKTTAKMAMLTIARSPLSRYPDVLESMASVGSALSLMSGGQYGQQYYKGRQGTLAGADDLSSTSRNGAFRRASASPNERIARWLDEKAPWVMPDHLTRAGESLVIASAIATYLKPEWGVVLAVGPYTGGGLVDGVDGNLARFKGISSLAGMLKDVRADKRQEIVTATVNSLLASKRGNKVAASQYAVAAMTASLPALLRATAEARGHLVSEDASGSRVVRGIEGGVGLGLNNQPGVGNVVSALMFVGNILTTAQRADVALRGSASPHYRGVNHNPQERAYAAARRDALLPMAVGGLVVGSVLLVREHRAQLTRLSRRVRTALKRSPAIEGLEPAEGQGDTSVHHLNETGEDEMTPGTLTNQ